MSRRNSYLVLGLLVAALVGVALIAVPGSPLHKSPTLGLDLQGGLEVTLQAVPPPNRELTEEDLDRSVEIMRNRVDKLGVSEPEIRTQGDDQIVIQLPGVQDPEAAAEIIGTTAQLELFDLEDSLTGRPSPSAASRSRPRRSTDSSRRCRRRSKDGESEAYYVVNTRTKRVVSGPYGSEAEALRASGGELPANRRLFAVPDGMAVVTCGEGSVVCPGAGGAGVAPDRTYYYLFEYDPPNVPQMTGEDFKLSGTRADFDTSPGASGRPIVTMEFTDSGSDKFEDITRGLWIRGKLRNVPQHFAIVLDREIKTFPQIDFTDSSLSGGIGGGRAQIQGLESFQEAKEIALVLQTGALPVKFETLDRTDISATLGKDSLERGLEGRDRRPDPRRDLPAHLLPLPRPRRGDRARDLRRLPLRDHPHLQRHADAARLRGPRADLRRRGRREHRHLRTHQGRGARREIDARRDRPGLPQGLRDDHRRERRHCDHGDGALRRRDRERPRVRAHAAPRHAPLAADRGRRDARDPRACSAGSGWLENPRVMGATGEGLPKWLRWDYIGRRRIWFAFSGALCRPLGRWRSRSSG